jgi:uncharacterized phosphosugar-binding protein
MQTKATYWRQLVLLAVLAQAGFAAAAPPAPFPYVWGTAYHVLPGTHTDESGYFSLCEGLDGKVYIGTAAYGKNAYLVEFDPVSEQQRIVVDTHQVCGLSATGYAAQAKIHTRNFVGPSGIIYVGSKQGYRLGDDDTADYPGGYAMTYDPRRMRAENLGMPYPTEGVIDVVADEGRGLLYIVTCETQHWMRYTLREKTYRELGPLLASYATTLVDARGRAHAITKDLELATYDPAADTVRVRPILLGSEKWDPQTSNRVPIWSLAADGRTAYLIMVSDPTLLRFDLLDDAEQVHPVSLGRMIEGKEPDSRSGLAFAPDGRLYAVIGVQNETGFGGGGLQHLVCYDPKTDRHQDLGVLAVRNPDFFAWKDRDGKAAPWSHGFQTLPDGTLTPVFSFTAHGLIVAQDGTLYVTTLYPFTLLRIGQFATDPEPSTPATDYVDFVLRQCDAIAGQLPAITAAAETVAARYAAGGAFVIPWNGHSLEQELVGRAGGMMGLGSHWKQERSEAEQAMDIAFLGWDRAPGKDDAAALRQLKERGVYFMGFGPRPLPELAEHVERCDVFFDTGLVDDRVVTLPGGGKAGRANHLVNALNGWVFVGELVGAFTRQGHMPPMFQSIFVPEAKAWNDRYLGRMQFHDDMTVAPQASGVVGRAYLDQMRSHVRRFKRTQLPAVREAADLIAREVVASNTTYLLSMGHMPCTYAGRYEDARWMKHFDLYAVTPSLVETVRQLVPDGALVLRLGYFGEGAAVRDLFAQKQFRVIMVSDESPVPGQELPANSLVAMSMGMAFGDACVSLEGYPVAILPPSGIMQIVAYEAVNTEVLARLDWSQGRLGRQAPLSSKGLTPLRSVHMPTAPR